jgi:Uma2 family endonuclease
MDIMVTKDPTAGWTYSEYCRLPDDGQHYEVIDGEICVTPAAGITHQRVVRELVSKLGPYIDANELGEIFFDVDVLFVDRQYLRPDLVFISNPIPEGGLSDRGVEVAPRLVIEVLSPQSHQYDRVKKPPRYRDFGVPEYWVVDPENKTVEVYALAEGIVLPVVQRDVVTFQPDPAIAALSISVPSLFR